MLKIVMPLCLAACIAVTIPFAVSGSKADEPKTDAPKSDAPTASAPAATPAPVNPDAQVVAAPAAMPTVATAITGKPPLDVIAANPIHTMKNPYTDDPARIEEGRKLYMSYSCNGCHGGGGGGGMCPPLTNDTWVYGSDDDILFRLISHGSQDLQKTYNIKRKGQEGVVGPMPPFGSLIKSDDELWKIIAFVHSVYKGSRRNW